MSHQLTIEPLGQVIEIEEGQTILDAALRAGIYLPHACGHGLCGTCKVQVSDGEIEHGEASGFALMDYEREEGLCLACCATVESDVVVEAEPFDHELVFPNYFMGPGFQDRALAERTLAEEVAKQNAAVQALWDVGVDAKGRLAALEGLAGSTATLRRYTAMSKVGAVAKMLDQELIERQYDKVVVFAIHKDPIDTLREALKRHGAVALYGGTPPTKRQRNIDKFQNDPKCRVFIGQVTAAGTLITLTAANQVVFLESSWVPADNAQAAMRCHRIGQTRPVFVRVIGLAGSIDEQVQATLRRKTATLTQLFDKQED